MAFDPLQLELKCFFENCGVDERVLEFKELTFYKLHRVLHTRRTLKLKYQDVYLPQQSSNVGYHHRCYKLVTSIKKALYDKVEFDSIELLQASQGYSPTWSSIDGVNKREANESFETESFCEPPELDCHQESTVKLETVDESFLEPPEILELKQENTIKVENLDESIGLELVKHEVNEDDDCEHNVNNVIVKDRKIYEHCCHFCLRARKQVKRKKCTTCATTVENLTKSLVYYNIEYYDKEMFTILQNMPPQDPIHYHKVCKLRYVNSLTRKAMKKCAAPTEWHIVRNIHAQVFEEIRTLVSEAVIKNKDVILLKDLLNYYRANLERGCLDAFGSCDRVFYAQHLQDKLMNSFGSEIKITSVNRMKIVACKDQDEFAFGDFSQLLTFKSIGDL